MRLDNSVRRTGRITKGLLQRVFESTCSSGIWEFLCRKLKFLTRFRKLAALGRVLSDIVSCHCGTCCCPSVCCDSDPAVLPVHPGRVWSNIKIPCSAFISESANRNVHCSPWRLGLLAVVSWGGRHQLFSSFLVVSASPEMSASKADRHQSTVKQVALTGAAGPVPRLSLSHHSYKGEWANTYNFVCI